jgi:hypothetical protein
MSEDIKALVNEAFAEAMQGFEQRLASSMQKALDIVTAQQEQRIRALEEDVARLQKHTGLT